MGVLTQLRTARPLEPAGRLIHCPGCDEDVDVIEIDLGGTGHAMRPDVCGACLVAGHDPEPLPPEPRP